MNSEKKKDFTNRITLANKTEMIVVLYDILLEYLSDAKDCLERNEKRAFRIEIGRARNTLKELMDSLDTSMEIGQNLLKLYIFCSGELTKAFLDYDEGLIYHVMSIIKKLRDAYYEVSKKDTTAPIMEHAEVVYTGFTYNKNSMVNNVCDRESNRGFLV